MGEFARTGLCCQCEGESIAEPGGSASGPWPASAWFGKSCGSIESNARQSSGRFSENIDPHVASSSSSPAVRSLNTTTERVILQPPELPGQNLKIASLQKDVFPPNNKQEGGAAYRHLVDLAYRVW